MKKKIFTTAVITGLLTGIVWLSDYYLVNPWPFSSYDSSNILLLISCIGVAIGGVLSWLDEILRGRLLLKSSGLASLIVKAPIVIITAFGINIVATNLTHTSHAMNRFEGHLYVKNMEELNLLCYNVFPKH